MVKPVGSACNLACAYCYSLHKGELLGQPAHPRMSDELLEEHICQYIEAQTGDEVVFSWKGGEPTLLGLDFFRRVVCVLTQGRLASCSSEPRLPILSRHPLSMPANHRPPACASPWRKGE
jgi:sulfatase maturation enzyme AslB (radical SAM superfamily)